MHTLGLERHLQRARWGCQGIELEQVGGLRTFRNPGISVTAGAGISGTVAPATAHEVRAIRRVVSGLADDDRINGRFKHTGAIRVVSESRFQRAQPVVGSIRTIKRDRRYRIRNLDLHDRAGVGTVARQGSRSANW